MIDFIKEIEDAAIETKREMIRDGLSHCTDAQVNMFNRMYGSIETILPEKMNRAYDQVMRTIVKNQEKTNETRKD